MILLLSAMTLPLDQTVSQDSKILNHELWDDILFGNVSKLGVVNYKGISSSVAFPQYLNKLSNSNPFGENWTRNDQLSFWINAYNAYTIKLILDNNVDGSIKEINNPWGLSFIKINNISMSLGEIEHEVLRKLREPRIHFALVCASRSCPKLLNHAYASEQLDKQLDFQTKQFINDSIKNDLKINELSLSKIFKWFRSDFTSENDLINFINKYSNVDINTGASISFQDYNWNLNN